MPKVNQEQAAKLLNVSDRSIRMAKELQRESPSKAIEVESGKLTLHKALKEVSAQKRQQQRTEMAEAGSKVKPSERWNVFHTLLRFLFHDLESHPI